MSAHKFQIDEDGMVFLANGQGRRALGFLGSLMRQNTPIAHAAEEWWRTEMASDEPLPLLPKRGPGRALRPLLSTET